MPVIICAQCGKKAYIKPKYASHGHCFCSKRCFLQYEKERVKKQCNYHPCEEDAIKKCHYCGDYFCEKHIRPKPMGFPQFNSNTPESKRFMDEYHSKDGHPCPKFNEVWEKRIEKEQENYWHALNKLNRSPSIKPKYFEDKRLIGPQLKETKSIKHKFNLNYLFAIILFATIFYLIWSYNPNIFAQFVMPSCNDGTRSNTCSFYKPLYCFNGTLKSNASYCGCPDNYIVKGNECEEIKRCIDGTIYDECSNNKPLYCDYGILVEKASKCGCNEEYNILDEKCVEIQRCSDGTEYGKCSKEKPYFCENGNIISQASSCGCPAEFFDDGDDCKSIYLKNPKNITLTYVVRSTVGRITIEVYGGLSDYLSKIPRSYICSPKCPTQEQIYQGYLNEFQQKAELDNLVSLIDTMDLTKDDKARVAVSIVQNIPYDYISFRGTLKDRYPYEVLYTNTGVCGEKSRLLAYILRGLGFGVVLFNYNIENHMAVGIACPIEYSFNQTGYCFIESTAPSIITDSSSDYVGVGKLTSKPDIFFISNGTLFDSVFVEYNDAQVWSQLNELSKQSGGVLNSYSYGLWNALVLKYGIKTG